MQAKVWMHLYIDIMLEIKVKLPVAWKIAIVQQVHYPVGFLQGIWL